MTVFLIDPTVTAGSDFPYDASSNGRTLTVQSTVTSVGDSPKFGYGSLGFNLPGATTAASITTVDSPDWLFSGQFTVEAWIYLQATSGGTSQQAIMAQSSSTGASNSAWMFSLNTAQTALQFQYSTSGTALTMLSGAKTFALNTWYHVAVDRDAGGVIRIYCDGAMLNSATMASSLFDSTTALYVGNQSSSSGRFPGLIEEPRITNGTARYASNAGYTIPSAEFPTNGTDDPYWANVKLLVRGPGGKTIKGRFRSFSALSTLRCGAGDEARLAATPGPVQMGTATWANGSRFLTMDTARTANIETCDATWTGVSTNVTQAANTAVRKHNTACLSLTIASAFTTGKVAYKTLPSTLDLSSYQQVSFWFRTSAGPAVGTLELRLCSDTLGDVPVHTIPLTEFSFLGSTWRAIVKDFGAALASNIASVSVYASADPGSLTIYLDNIIACKASSSADAITHLSLVGKNTAGEPEWYPLQSIDGTSVELGNWAEASVGTAANTPRPYAGTSETVALYRLQPLDAVNGYASPASLSPSRVIGASGTDGTPITISGGWDATYTNQTGVTWLSGAHAMSGFLDASGKSYVSVSKIGAAHFMGAGPVLTNLTSTGVRLQYEAVVGCSNTFNQSFLASLYISAGNVVHCQNGFNIGAGSGDFTIIARRVTGSLGYGYSGAPNDGGIGRVYIDQIDNCGTYGVWPSATTGKVTLYSPTLSNNVTADVFFPQGNTVLINALSQSATKVLYSAPGMGDTVRFQNFGRDATDQRTYFQWGTVFSDTTTRHTASGLAWKLSITNVTYINSSRPARLPLVRRRVLAGVATTIACWMLRDNAALNCGIRVAGGSLAGIGSAGVPVSAAMTAAANTWEQVSITFTPSEDGVVEVFGWAWTTATTYSCWFDDLTVV
jgi:hypothetical protein